MTIGLWRRRLSRRSLLKSAAVASSAAIATSVMPRTLLGATKTVKIGFLAPLTGAVAAWGKPGYDGCLIWQDWVNQAGGVDIGGERYMVELIPYDDEYDPSKTRAGAAKLIKEDGVKFIMMLGGDTTPAVVDLINREGMLASTLVPQDLSPESTTLIAPAEVHPIYNVTGVEWLVVNHPDLKNAIITTQDDGVGLPSVATYLAAFEAAGIEMVDEPLLFDLATTDFAPIVTKIMSQDPDIVCLDTAYADFVHPICEQLFQANYKGKIISCTADFYDKIIEKTSVDFVEGLVFQFPDFDDPAMNDSRINFTRPNDFFVEYAQRYGADEWGAVSWEYAAIMDLWAAGAEKAESVEPEEVLAAMKAGGRGKHVFGEADWWGKEMYGIDNALVGNWPVVVIESGKAVIKEFRSIPEWWDKHKELMIKHMESYDQMYYQRG